MQNSDWLCFKCSRPIHSNDPVHSGLHLECFNSWFQTYSEDDFGDIVARSSESFSSNDWARIASSFFHGKFRKYSARLGEKNYLLKVQQTEFPELPRMEYLCNQIATSLKLPIPNHFLIRFQNELDTFVSENFMQYYPGCDLVHIYRYLETPDQYTCEGLLNVLEKNVKRYEDIQRFVKICLFDSLIGNHDRHGRNLGLIQSNQELRLSPFYDNPSYLALESPLLLGALHEPRGVIGTLDTSEPTMKDYIKEWLRLDLDEPVREFKSALDLEKINLMISNSYISDKRKLAFTNLIKRRMEELKNATKHL